MLIIRRKCKSTKFVVVHQLKDFGEKYKVTMENNSIHIVSEKFKDRILYEDKYLSLILKNNNI